VALLDLALDGSMWRFIGIPGMEKVVFDKEKAASLPERVEKETLIYGMSRRDPALSRKVPPSLKGNAWTEEGEVWGGLGLDKWACAETSALHLYVISRRFFN